jgi:hypothetical protein
MIKWFFRRKTKAKARPVELNKIDPHAWATKMEIRRRLSGKSDLKIETTLKQSS